MPEYLTTKELAELLRIKERKVYDLAASGDVPCSKAMGKLLFPRDAVEAWLVENSTGFEARSLTPRPNVFLGSHDPLLEWALRESLCGLATYFDGSVDGVDRFHRREGIATGLHLYDAELDAWNVPYVAEHCGREPAVLVQWARRKRGIILREKLADRVSSLSDLAGCRLVPRQPEAGAQRLLEDLLAREGVPAGRIEMAAPARSETDAALAVLDGSADAAFGLQAIAVQCRLPFVPVIEERFDLLVDRRAWFEPAFQVFVEFCRSDGFLEHSMGLSGYKVTGFGAVEFNGP